MTSPPFKNAHAQEVQEVCKRLKGSMHGLGQEEAERRLKEYGLNELPEKQGVSLLVLVLRQFKSWLVFMLIIAALISAIAGEAVDTWVIIVVVFINAAIGFSQEYRAEKAIASLRKLIVKVAKVWRDGKLMSIPAAQLVPGDVLVLEEGDSIAADARLLEAKNLRTVESSLTGESLPVAKTIAPQPLDLPLADQKCMVWKGTLVAGGYAKAMVTATGTNTAIGDISNILGQVKERRTNFMKKTDVLGKQMSVIALASAGMIFFVGYFWRGFEVQEILLTSIAALVAAVPEGLPAVISIVLAIGAHRMAKRNAVIKEFTATEALGAVSAILTDKTGTLTQNSLTVRKVFIPSLPEFSVSGEGWLPVGNFMQEGTMVSVQDKPALEKLLNIALVSNNAGVRHNEKTDSYELVGDPTEGALLVLGKKGGRQPENYQALKLDDLPFDSEVKLRATLLRNSEQNELHVTGAPEVILARSTHMLTAKGEQKLDEAERVHIQQKIQEWSSGAMRVIGLAYKKQQADKIDASKLNELVLAGIVGMIDPPRPDARAAVKKCRKAGIRVIMVTGDHANTAFAIAKATGIIEKEGSDDIRVLTEQQLLRLSKEEFDLAIDNVSVFARLTPKMKLQIANRLQAKGHLIAMTGDGVNDAPALKQADVGISMGIMGTDVARDSSDVVLADDNFATIVNAVEEGRIVFTNARQTSFFLVTTNMAESSTLLLSIALGLPLPLTATQILWLNLVTDGVTVMALATEPGHTDIMRNQPPLKEEKILNREILPFLLINIALMTGLSLATFFYYIEDSIEKARTGVFIVMAFTQLFNVFNLRSVHLSAFSIGFWSNRNINWAVSISVLLLILVTEVHALAAIFHFRSLHIRDFLLLFLLSSSVLWAAELYKWMKAIKKKENEFSKR